MENKYLEKLIEEMVINRENISIYFFFGSGFTKYIDKDKYLLWSDMSKKKYGGIDVNNFFLYTNLDINYQKEIKDINNINEKGLKLRDKQLFKIIKELSSIISRQKESSIRIITTNHCDTIQKSTEFREVYYLQDLDKFLNSNFSVYQIHSQSSNNFIYTSKAYLDFFLKNDYGKILETFKSHLEQSQKNNYIFVFGSSLSEVHITSLIELMRNNGNFRIIYITSAFEKENKNTTKIQEELLEKGIYLLQAKDHKYDEEVFNNLYELILKKYDDYKRSDEKYNIDIFDFTSSLTEITNQIIKEYETIKTKEDKINKFKELVKKNDTFYISTILRKFYDDKITVKCYLDFYLDKISNSKSVINIVDFKWFLTSWVFGMHKNSNVNKLVINYLIKHNKLKYEFYDLCYWLNYSEINKNNIENIFKLMLSKKDYFEPSIPYISIRSLSQRDLNEINKIEERIIKFIDKNDDPNSYNKFILNLYFIKLILGININIIKITLKKHNISINDLIEKITTTYYNISWFNSNTCFKLIYDYLQRNKKEFNEFYKKAKTIVNNDDNNYNYNYNYFHILSFWKLENAQLQSNEKKNKDIISKWKELSKKVCERKSQQNKWEIKNIIPERDKELSVFTNNIINKSIDNIEIKDLEKIKEFKEDGYKIIKNDLLWMYSSIFQHLIDSYLSKTKQKNDENLYKKLLDLIFYINKAFINIFVEKNIIYLHQSKELNYANIKLIAKLIDDLVENKLITFAKSIINFYLFNSKLDIAYDFYLIDNRKFSVFSLLELIKGKSFKKLLLSDKLLEVYKKLIEKNIDDLIQDKKELVFLKYLSLCSNYKNNKQDISKKLLKKVFSLDKESLEKNYKFLIDNIEKNGDYIVHDFIKLLFYYKSELFFEIIFNESYKDFTFEHLHIDWFWSFLLYKDNIKKLKESDFETLSTYKFKFLTQTYRKFNKLIPFINNFPNKTFLTNEEISEILKQILFSISLKCYSIISDDEKEKGYNLRNIIIWIYFFVNTQEHQESSKGNKWNDILDILKTDLSKIDEKVINDKINAIVEYFKKTNSYNH